MGKLTQTSGNMNGTNMVSAFGVAWAHEVFLYDSSPSALCVRVCSTLNLCARCLHDDMLAIHVQE